MGFMSRSTTQLWTSRSSAIDTMPLDQVLEETFAEDDDPSMTDVLNVHENLVSQEYTVYSSTFQVPAFYFTVHDQSLYILLENKP